MTELDANTKQCTLKISIRSLRTKFEIMKPPKIFSIHRELLNFKIGWPSALEIVLTTARWQRHWDKPLSSWVGGPLVPHGWLRTRNFLLVIMGTIMLLF